METWRTKWQNLPKTHWSADHLPLITEICRCLSQSESQKKEFVSFLEELFMIPGYLSQMGTLLKIEEFRIGIMYLYMKQKDCDKVFNHIKNSKFSKQYHHLLLKIWDECHYLFQELKTGQKLTPLAKFRIRKNYPPPLSICPEGRKCRLFDNNISSILWKWLNDNYHYPFLCKEEAKKLAAQTGLTVRQVLIWMKNARCRYCIKVTEKATPLDFTKQRVSKKQPSVNIQHKSQTSVLFKDPEKSDALSIHPKNAATIEDPQEVCVSTKVYTECIPPPFIEVLVRTTPKIAAKYPSVNTSEMPHPSNYGEGSFPCRETDTDDHVQHAQENCPNLNFISQKKHIQTLIPLRPDSIQTSTIRQVLVMPDNETQNYNEHSPHHALKIVGYATPRVAKNVLVESGQMVNILKQSSQKIPSLVSCTTCTPVTRDQNHNATFFKVSQKLAQKKELNRCLSMQVVSSDAFHNLGLDNTNATAENILHLDENIPELELCNLQYGKPNNCSHSSQSCQSSILGHLKIMETARKINTKISNYSSEEMLALSSSITSDNISRQKLKLPTNVEKQVVCRKKTETNTGLECVQEYCSAIRTLYNL